MKSILKLIRYIFYFLAIMLSLQNLEHCILTIHASHFSSTQ